MTREEKFALVEELTSVLGDTNNFYITDISDMTAIQVNNLRRECFKQNVSLRVVKNSLIKKSLDALEIKESELDTVLKGSSALMIGESINAVAKLIKEFRKTSPKPILKAAYIDQSIFAGEDSLETVLKLKTKNQLIGEIIGLLQSPIKNVIGGLQASGGQKIAGLVKALQEKENS